MPLALLEAMAAGLPVIATRVGGVPEAVRDGREGLLVPAGDPGALASAIRVLAADREARGRMGEAARARIREEYSVDRMAARTCAVYEEACEEGA